MWGNEMTAKEIRELFEVFITMLPSEARYNHNFNEHLHTELEESFKYRAWVSKTYPEVHEAWVALNKLRGE